MALVSVVIPFYEGAHDNAQGKLRQALQSLSSQSAEATDIEVVLVQDGGHVNLTGLLREFPLLRIRHFRSTTARGLSAARNGGVEASSSDIVLFLDADDALMPTCIADIFVAFANGSPDMCFSNSVKRDARMESTLRTIDSSHYFELFVEYGRSPLNPIFHSIFVGHCLAIRKEVFLSLGGFNAALHCGEITDLVLRFVARNYRLWHINKVLYEYRDNPRGLSKSPLLNHNRAMSIRQAFCSLFDVTLSRAEPLGRVAPFQHFHFMLYDQHNAEIRLPYLCYDTLSIQGLSK